MYIYTYIYIYIYIYNTYIKKLCQHVFIYNKEGQCTYHTSCTQVLELPQRYLGDQWET